MNFKKILASALAMVVLITGLTACSSETQETSNAAPSEVVKAVLEEVPIESVVEKDESKLEDYYTDLDTSKVESAAFALCGSGSYPDEIAVIKCNSATDAEAAKTALQARLDSQKELYSTYTPDEMYKLDGAIIYTKGEYAIFIALSDNEKAKSIVEDKLSS